jgi:hypothetical protein
MSTDSLTLHRWENYEFPPAFVLGFHGCDKMVGEAILRGRKPHLKPSKNDYDWLGNGIYFWEGDPLRAYQFAVQRAEGGRNSKGDIVHPFVLGAIINLGRCLDLADQSAILKVKKAYQSYKSVKKISGEPLPHNGRHLKARWLDCEVFNWLHYTREQDGEEPYDTVRGLFWEGSRIYPNAGVNEFNHVQICVRKPACILGYFRPIESITGLSF